VWQAASALQTPKRDASVVTPAPRAVAAAVGRERLRPREETSIVTAWPAGTA
jgi:hypothetical protein